jgi:hypothetical protein
MPALALVAKPTRDAGVGVGDTVLVFVGVPPGEAVGNELTVLVALRATLEELEVEAEVMLIVLVNVAAYSRRACPLFDVMIKFPPDV